MLAFPTSATIAVVKRHLPWLTVVVLLSSIISFFSMAALSRLLIESIAIGTGSTGTDIPFALSTLTHSVSTPVAIGYHNVLCASGHAANVSTTGPAAPHCASEALIATGCVLTGTIVMIFGLPILDACRVSSSGSRGTACGSCGMALGIAALRIAKEDSAVAVAAISYALFAIFSAIILSVTALDDTAISLVFVGSST